MGQSKGARLTDALRRRCLGLDLKGKTELMALLSQSIEDERKETDWEKMDRASLLLRQLYGWDVRRKRRDRAVVDIRTVFCYRMRQEGMYYRTIGGYIGQDHSTVVCSCKRMENALEYPKMYADLVAMYNRFNGEFSL